MKNRLVIFSSQWIVVSALMASAFFAESFQPALASGSNSLSVAPQSSTVKGTVYDNTGEVIIGASVMEKGTTNGTSTDLDGNFLLKVSSPNSTIVVTYVGYKTFEIKASDPRVKKISMTENASVLNEVVVVGYGSQKKETLTGAITVISDKMLKDKGTLSSPLQALQGQVPGVMITRNSSAPGDESWSMKIRGAVSTNTADPLVIIDGVAYDGINALRNINPSDIETMNFLKDASAAIYGSRAAGGVVLITTKQAKEGKTKIEYTSSLSLKYVGLQPHLMTLDQWANAVITARTNDGYTESDTWIKYAKLALANEGHYIDLNHNSNPFVNAFTDVKDFVFMDTNWTDILFGSSSSTQHNLSLSGGTEKNLYRLSLGYMYDGSNLKWGDNNNRRINLRLTNKIQATDNFKIESAIAYNRQDQVAPTQLSSTLTSSYPQPGLPASTIDGKPYAWGTWLSPVWYAELGGDNKLKVSEVNISENFTYNISKDLDAIVNIGYNTGTATRDIKKLAINSYNYAGDELNNTSAATQSSTYYTKSNSRTDFYSATGYLNYHKSLNEKHNIGATVGTQYETTQYDYVSTTTKDIFDALNVINGSGTTSTTAQKYQTAISSYYSRLNYNYKSKYLAEVNMRYDGTSKFKVNRWSFFYGLSTGWRISEESFMKDFKWLNELKLRGSYGQVGSQSDVANYEGEQFYTFSSGSGAYLGTSKTSYINTDGAIATHNRAWERIHNYNVGVDFGLLNSRLTGTFEVFYKKNNNMLIDVTYPAILGDDAGETNSGKFRAHGWEGQATWSDKIGKVRYHIGGSYSYTTNTVTDIGGVTTFTSGYKAAQQGYPLHSIFGLRYTGKIQNEDQLRKYIYYFQSGNGIGMPSTLRLGDNMFQDVNGDGKLDYNDYVYLGSDDPKISFSFNLGFEWNNFDLSAVFQGVAKRTVFRSGDSDSNVNWRIPMRSVYLNTSNQSVGKTWSVENPDAFYPTYTNDATTNIYNYQASSWSVEDGSYIRLKTIMLGYNVPNTFIKKTKALSSCRLYVSGTDLWEYSKINDGWDPEASRTVTTTGRYPFVRTVTFGLDVSF